MDTIHLFEKAGLGEAPYDYLGCEDTGKSSTSCQFCHTGIRYKFHLQSKDGKRFFVGSDCIYKSGDHGLTKIAKTERSRIAKAQREAKRQKQLDEKKAKKEAILQNKIDTFYKENESIKYVLDWAKNTSGLALSIVNNLNTWGNLTEKQIELLCDLYYKAQKTPTLCPQGKHIIEGTIVSLKYVENFFGFQRNLIQKMIVETKEGYRVYGTVPANLQSLSTGDKIRFVANIERSEKDSTFGFFSRPSKAEFLGTS